MEDPKKILESFLQNIAKEENYKNSTITVQQIDSGGANYSSYIFLATISSNLPVKKDLKLFAKVAAIGAKGRENMHDLYKNETFFYTDFVKTYKNLEEKYEIPLEYRLRTAKFYGCSKEKFSEIIVLEDLTASGFKSFDRFKSVTWHQTTESLEQLAKLHALSMALANEEPKQFEIAKQTFSVSIGENLFKELIRNLKSQIIEATEDRNKSRVANFIENNLNSDKFKYISEPISKEVIIHGDYRPNNLMYKTESGKCQVIPLDLQTLHCGSPTFDLLYFIGSCFHKELLDKHFQLALDHYYTELIAALRRLKVDPELAYSRKVFEYELKEMLPFTVTLGLCLLLALTVSEDDAPKDLENFGLDNLAFPVNDLYKKRLNDFIDFYTKIGIIP